MITPEEDGLYLVRDRVPGTGRFVLPELAQFRAGEFLFFGTDDNAAPDRVWIMTKVRVIVDG